MLIHSGYKQEESVLPFFSTGSYGYHKKTAFPFLEFRSQFDSIYEKERAAYLTEKRIQSDILLHSFCSLEHFTVMIRKTLAEKHKETKCAVLQDIAWEIILDLLLQSDDPSFYISREESDTWLDTKFILTLVHSYQNIYEKDIEKRRMFESFLKKMMKKGNLHPKQYAMIMDATSYMFTQQTVFGEMFRIEEDQIKLEPFTNIQAIDSVRAEVYLSPLWIKCKLKNIEFPENYYKK